MTATGGRVVADDGTGVVEVVETILVPVDETPESERAIPVAAVFAGALGARLELVTVESPHTDGFATTAYHGGLLDALPPTIEKGSTVTFTDGPVAEAIAEVARHRPGPVVCMATRAHGPVAEVVLGSVADGLLRTGHDPMLLVGPACDRRWPEAAIDAAELVAALDGSRLDDEVIETALGWGERLGLTTRFVTVTDDPGIPGVPSPAAAILARATAAAERAERPASTSLLEGTDPGAAVLAAIRETPALLVVGSHRRGPWARLALGTTALWLVHRAPCPVLVAGTEPRRDVR